jgi:hypothetical protein
MKLRAPAHPWLAAATAIAAVYSLVVLVLPTRGLALMGEDWEFLFRVARTPWPGRWIDVAMDHWSPLFFALLELKVRLLGAGSFPFVVWAWANHVLNLYLLGRLALSRTGDERAAAVATALFGVTTQYRAVIWWGFTMTGWAPAFTVTLLGLFAFDRYRKTGRGLVAACAAVFVAPLFMGSGLALGPALALDALSLPKKPRRRALGALAVAIALYAAIYVPAQATSERPKLFPRDAHEVGLAAVYAAKVAGMASAGGVLLAPVEVSADRGVLFLALYVGLVAAAIATAAPEERWGIASLQGILVTVSALIGATRWGFDPIHAAESRYTYPAAMVWVVTLAFLLRAALRRSPRETLGLAAVVLPLLALAHAQAAHDDSGRYSPRTRRDHPIVLAHFVAAVERATGPVYDAHLPDAIVSPATPASCVYALLVPNGKAVFTNWRTPATLAPYTSDPVLEAVAESH